MYLLISLFACDPEPSVLPADADRDGFDETVDCDDTNAAAFPGSVEFCDGFDNDCNGEIDEGTPWGAQTFYVDADGDQFGGELVEACEQPEGTVRVGGDCDDTDDRIAPGRPEQCDGIDENCDGLADNDPEPVYYSDSDGDGFGNPNALNRSCHPDPSWVLDASDCDDTDPAVLPGATEICNGHDDNCDGLSDDDDPAMVEPLPWFVDADGDGFGGQVFSVVQCAPPPGTWSHTDDDCDDGVASTYPGAPEFCDGADQDCDGTSDGPDTPYLPGPRVPISLVSTAASDSPWVAESVDLDALYATAGGMGPAPMGVRFASGSCATSYEELPTRFVDGWQSLVEDGPTGDGFGVLAITYDPDASSATSDSLPAGTLEGWLYFDAQALGDVSTSPDQISAAALTASLDPAMRLENLQWRGASLAAQDTVLAGVIKASGPVLTDIDADVIDDGTTALGRVYGSAEASGLGWSVQWWMPAGQQALYGRVELVATADLALEAATDWRDGVTGFAFQPVGVVSALGSDMLYESPAGALGVRVLDAPAAASIVADDGQFAIIGTDLPGGGVETALVPQGAVLSVVTVVLLPGDDAASVQAGFDQLDAPVSFGF